MPDYVINCLPTDTKSGGDEELRLDIDGKTIGVKLRISRLNQRLVSHLPDRTLDLLEIAALVYGVDAAVSRGGSADQNMGRKWHRRFIVNMPVRDHAFWSGGDVSAALEETLMFLSGDRFEFDVSPKANPEAEQFKYFKFDTDSAWKATRVLMFSGGLDSFAGALEEIVDQQQQVALVSHFSASKIAPVQRALQNALAEKFGQASCKHVPVQVQMTRRGLKEGTHRSRSFLFAVLGAITAQAFGVERVSFHENGVVSLNLPPVGNVLGTRATRTTHPQTLVRFTRLFDKVFDKGVRVDNPFFWKTKKEVVETVARLNMADQIAHSRSCADVHNQTKQYPHCGRCSQCIDRRFAVLSAGLQRYDPEEAYRVDLMREARHGVIDREIALSYVRNAQAFEHIGPSDLERLFPPILDAVGHLGHPPETALSMISQLLKRHGKGVAEILRGTLRDHDFASFPEGSLPRLYGDAQRQVLLPAISVPAQANAAKNTPNVLLEIDETQRCITIEDQMTFDRSATADLLIELAKAWLEGAGRGSEPLDYPMIGAQTLAAKLDLSGDEALRRRVNRARKDLEERFISSGLDAALGRGLIENIPWHGYRLRPEQVTVQRVSLDR